MYPLDAILLGAGSGTRFSRSSDPTNLIPKQFQLIEGKPVFIWALESLVEESRIRRLAIVVAQSHLDLAQQLLNRYFVKPSQLQIEFVLGGERRQDSSVNGLNYLKGFNPWPKTVLIHDACRPFLGNTLRNGLENCSKSRDLRGWIPGIPITETIKRVSNGKVVETVERSSLMRIQTPQLFDFSLLVELIAKIETDSRFHFTDDASLFEHFGQGVSVFPGDDRNVKLTFETDAQFLSQQLKNQRRNVPCESEPVTTFTA